MPVESTAAERVFSRQARFDGRTGIRQPVKTRVRVLLLEDDPDDAELELRTLQDNGFDVVSDVVQTLGDFSERLRGNEYDLILADYNLRGWRGMESIEALHQQGLDIPVIVVTGSLGEVNAVECIKQGAADYVLKDNLVRLPMAVRRALQEGHLRQQHRRDQQDLLRSNQDLEQFAYVASHDLQEPLRMVAIFTRLLGERYRGKLDEEADKYIQFASEGAVRMQSLIQDLLAFSRVGRDGITAQSVDCNQVLEQALSGLEAAIQESGARIQRERLPAVVADRGLLVQLFQNLIGNAIKFRRHEQPTIQISARGEAGEWKFAVSDDGIGIAPEHREIIFLIFKRLHTRAEYPGNGLGLAICKKILEHHGGRIWVESRAGGGSTFYFTLPKRRPVREAGAENTHDAGDSAR